MDSIIKPFSCKGRVTTVELILFRNKVLSSILSTIISRYYRIFLKVLRRMYRLFVCQAIFHILAPGLTSGFSIVFPYSFAEQRVQFCQMRIRL